MTWAKLDDSTTDDPGLLTLSRTVRLVHIEAIVWSCRHLTDGHIPRHALRRLTDEPDAEAAAAELVTAGIWAETATGWQIVNFLEDQMSRVEVDGTRALAQKRTKRWRLHSQGEHRLCLPGNCRYASRDASGDGVSDTPRPSLPPVPPRDREGIGMDSGDGNGPDGPAVPDREEQICSLLHLFDDVHTNDTGRHSVRRSLQLMKVDAEEVPLGLRPIFEEAMSV